MPNSKLMSMLGMTRRAGKIAMGHDAVLTSLKIKKSFMVLMSSELSSSTKKDIEIFANKYCKDAQIVTVDIKPEEFEFCLSKRCACVSIEDVNFSNGIKNILDKSK